MRLELLRAAAVALAVTLSSGAAAQTVSLVGSELSLRVEARGTATSRLSVISFPARARVSETRVEFPDVDSLFDERAEVPPGFARALVDVEIDAGPDYIEIDFDNSPPSRQFARGHLNSYVFTFDASVPIRLIDFEIDRSVTTLGLTPERVWVTGNELYVNVEGLSFNARTFARIYLRSALVN